MSTDFSPRELHLDPETWPETRLLSINAVPGCFPRLQRTNRSRITDAGWLITSSKLTYRLSLALDNVA
ncbi:hypothetical protein WJX77_010877 [Trebouxia sp. C0004]